MVYLGLHFVQIYHIICHPLFFVTEKEDTGFELRVYGNLYGDSNRSHYGGPCYRVPVIPENRRDRPFPLPYGALLRDYYAVLSAEHLRTELLRHVADVQRVFRGD